MSWRQQGATGSNNVPLGTRRRFERDDDAAPHEGEPPRGRARSRSPAREPVAPVFKDGPRRRKRKNGWGDASDNKAAGLMGLPTVVTVLVSQELEDAFALHLRIEEISQKLRIDDVIPKDAERSPSPPPQYDNFGKRVNTREARYRKKLEDERHKLVEEAIKVIPDYHPPSDYRRPTKTQEKVYVPVNDYPEINFIGLLIGPRGDTLKGMERKSGAKIAIRGKGSVKEGKGRSDAAHGSNQEEDLHCLIMADTEEKVNKAKDLINNIIETAASIPEGQNELKRSQLRYLAELNGTLRDDENQACQNCGKIGHRKYDCPEQKNYTASIVCRVCGNAGHMARDCPDRAPGWRGGDRGGRLPPNRGRDAIEFDSLMAQLGGSGGAGGPTARIEAGPGGSGGFDNGQAQDVVPPWQRADAGAPPPWARNRDDRGGSSSGPPPWASSNNNDSYGYNQSGGYGQSNAASSVPPWQSQQQQNQYSGYNGGYNNYGDQAGGFAQANYNPSAAPWSQDYGAVPPPPPGAPGDAPPPPPPQEDVPPPPPPM